VGPGPRWGAALSLTLPRVKLTAEDPSSPPSPTSAWGPAGRLSWGLLFVGVASASLAAILVRYATGAEPLAIAFWRCAAGAALLLPFAFRAARTARPTAAELRLCAAAGVFLALHFATWITSLRLTTVAASVLLVSTTPVFVALAGRLLWDERLSPAGVLGISLTVVGSALVAGGDLDDSSLLGNAFALAGGASIAGYVLAGRRARRTMGIVLYAVVTYACAALLLGATSLALGIPLGGYPQGTWLALAGIVVGPQLLGHTVINFVLRDIDATSVSVVVMAEPPIASALAFLLFGEVPPALALPGGVLLLVGIYLTTTRAGQEQTA
jgi:drug/metabolite transporter (DMT)-like permease